MYVFLNPCRDLSQVRLWSECLFGEKRTRQKHLWSGSLGPHAGTWTKTLLTSWKSCPRSS